MDMASARREGACNPHNRCVPADRARRRRALLSGTAWLALYGGMRPATCPVPWSAGTVEVSSPSHA